MKVLITVWNHKYRMRSYCLKSKKDTEKINSKVSNTGNGKTMLLSKWAVCGAKKSRFIRSKKQRDY